MPDAQAAGYRPRMRDVSGSSTGWSLAGVGLSLALGVLGACTQSSKAPDTGPARDVAEPDVGEADAEQGDLGPSASDAGFPPCSSNADCPESLRCLFWEPGCQRQGECGRPVGLDALFSNFGICSCEGRWLGNVNTYFPFQRRDFDGTEACWPTDAGPPPEGCIPRERPNCDNAGCAGACPPPRPPLDAGVRRPCSEVLACSQACAGSAPCRTACFESATARAAELYESLAACIFAACQVVNDAGIVPCPDDPGACAVCFAANLDGASCPAERAACVAD